MLNNTNYIYKRKKISTFSFNVLKKILNNYLIKGKDQCLHKMRLDIIQHTLYWNSVKWRPIQRVLVIKLLEISFDVRIFSILLKTKPISSPNHGWSIYIILFQLFFLPFALFAHGLSLCLEDSPPLFLCQSKLQEALLENEIKDSEI